MNLKKIQEFIDLAKINDVSELSYKENDIELSVSFVTGQTGTYVQSNLSAPLNVETKNETTKLEKSREISGHEVKSPLVGTFYEASGPGQSAFVKVGDKVSKGQVLCILEAMKIMNEIEADVSGTIASIEVNNEDFVEFGQTMFVIKTH